MLIRKEDGMDISSLRERRDNAISVSELNTFIKGIFDSNRLLNSIYVRGEISNFVNHRSGHLYFSLKDADGQIRAVMFRSSAVKLKFVPENGMKVTVHGSVTVFPRDGSYQLYVTSMQPDGIGALYLAYEQMKLRLESEGLFDPLYKKDIPEFPTRIGVITSPTGAAVRDIINVIGRRYPIATIYLYPALVQGDGSEDSLVAGIDYFDRSGLVDTVIIGRGGGSMEDLWSFNSEKLARRIFECKVPVISAVGHETDFTICDFVADLRAPTPSAAAELSVPDIRELIMRIDSYSDRLDRALAKVLTNKRERLMLLLSSGALRSAVSLLSPLSVRVDTLSKNAERAFFASLDDKKHRFGISLGKLEALNPISVLARGYTMTSVKGEIIRSAENVSIGDVLTVRFSDGEVFAQAEEIHKQN
jgi:exodeoxyribonuclease VII large subunit